jgi:meso-butanediol dehydrogenase/(S,S)-butanediol dehydrogenase/diacetyl reductase
MIADLTGKAALVTGGASGIGRGISLALAGQGADVIVADLNHDGARAVAAEVEGLGRRSVAVEVDVTDRASIESMVGRSVDSFTDLDILINDAGVIGAPGWSDRDSPADQDWDIVNAVNVRGVVMVSEAVSPMMKKRRYGKIINIASMASRYGSIDLPHYNASKAAVVSWTRSNALQLAPHNINVNAICPGMLWTPMWQQIAALRSRVDAVPEYKGLSGREYFDRTIESLIPLNREQTPEDIGATAAFLASDDAKNITGQAIQVDGGRVMV